MVTPAKQLPDDRQIRGRSLWPHQPPVRAASSASATSTVHPIPTARRALLHPTDLGPSSTQGRASAGRSRTLAHFSHLEELELSLDRRGQVSDGDRRRWRPQPEPSATPRELCHDLRQPIAALRALAEALGADAGLTEAGRGRVGLIQREVERLSAIVLHVLAPAEPGLVDLLTLAQQACDSGDAVSYADVELVATGPAVVRGDPVLLLRLVDNLLCNARRAAGPCGRVRLTVSTTSLEVLLRVEDEGGGDQFEDGLSSGLGLLIVQNVAIRHNGALDCGPSSIGGRCVTVTLPLALPLPSVATA